MYKEYQLTLEGGESTSIFLQGEPSPERPLCFVVGLSSHYSDKFSEDFKSRFCMVFLDLYWTDEHFSQDYIDQLDMKKLVSHLELTRCFLAKKFGRDVEKIFIAAHSAYGFLSVEYALKFPSYVWGIINICSPLFFDESKLVPLQEAYLHSNFCTKASGHSERHARYVENKKKFSQGSEFKSEKDNFVSWYNSLGPALWKDESWWASDDKKATALWNPWKLPTKSNPSGVTKDVNVSMLLHYLKLVSAIDGYQKLLKLRVPMLYVLGLYDSRVSLFLLEDKHGKKLKLPKNVEVFLADSGHWPMFEESSREDFDKRVLCWREKALDYPKKALSAPLDINEKFLEESFLSFLIFVVIFTSSLLEALPLDDFRQHDFSPGKRF